MKRILPFIFLVLCLDIFQNSYGQDSIAPKVSWTFSAQKKSDNQYQLSIKGTIEKGWRLFSTTMSDELPNTRISLDSSTLPYDSISSIGENSHLVTAKEPLLDNAEVKYFENEVEFVVNLEVKEKKKDIRGTITYMAYKGQDFTNPESEAFKFAFDANGNLVSRAGGLQESASAAQELKRNNIDLKNPVNDCGGTGAENTGGLWGVFVLGFLGGLIALLTPCVFPMIPLTVSFFTKRTENRKKGIGNALLYGFFIFMIYVLLSVPFHIVGSVRPEIFNNIATNVWLNLFFFLVFIVFALSFFGLFEITIPSSIANKAGAKSGVGSMFGIFFMALTLALVSFSCTGPILGTLLAGSLSSSANGAWPLTAGMAGFGLALALPFALFALFPGWLHAIPKSGGWLTSVKIVLGFVELALAVKFLSNADLVEHWGILKRETFIFIWIVIGICTTLYLFGILKFKHDPPPKKLGPVRISIGLIFLGFTLYLLPGITKTKYANLTLISGLAPPLSYSLYGHELVKLNGVEANVVNDYHKALELAREQNKPILIDFTGWACVNCRNMEENVWPDARVKNLIQNNYILVSLYVDDRAKLPEADQFLFTASNNEQKKIKTIGDKYATLQSENFIISSQPFYVLISPDEKLLTHPVAYTPEIQKYAAWLKCGLDAFSKSK